MPKVEHTSLGRRKRAVARLRIKAGSGTFSVNDREFTEYFNHENVRLDVLKPLRITESENKYDIKVTVRGGGQTGQAGAVRLAIARALQEIDPDLRSTLKSAGLLTRDARVSERKKYGLAGARRGYQFSKR